jgi:sugar O-acyltransferase (sialic acid O-acetyltransferase NeuD family)
VSLPVIVLAAGGHAKVLIDALKLMQAQVLGIVDADPAKSGQLILGVPVLGGDDEVGKHRTDMICLVNGLGSVRGTASRLALFERFHNNGYRFASVIHPSAILSSEVAMCEGVQIMAGAVVQNGCSLGANAIINTRVALDHDCRIGDHVHVAPGATLSGGVEVGNGSHIGTGATIIQGIRIGSNCLVGAGAVVIRDVPDGATVLGVPAKEI